jgi:hypothetical protein
MGRINEGLVIERKTLSQLLNEGTPFAMTRGGKQHFFDKKSLDSLGVQLPEEWHHLLRIPVLFYFDMDVPDSCYLVEETAVHVLQMLGEISTLRAPREGKVWVARAIVFALMRKYPSIIQIVMG